MKTKSLSFVFMGFSETGLFNGLRPIKIKNLFPCPTVPEMSQPILSPSPSYRLRRMRNDLAMGKSITQISGISKRYRQ
jgi:hypothetical protein